MLQLLPVCTCTCLYLIVSDFTIPLYNFKVGNNFIPHTAYCLLALIIPCSHHTQTLLAKPHLVDVLKPGIKILYTSLMSKTDLISIQRNYSMFIYIYAGNNHFFLIKECRYKIKLLPYDLHPAPRQVKLYTPPSQLPIFKIKQKEYKNADCNVIITTRYIQFHIIGTESPFCWKELHLRFRVHIMWWASFYGNCFLFYIHCRQHKMSVVS